MFDRWAFKGLALFAVASACTDTAGSLSGSSPGVPPRIYQPAVDARTEGTAGIRKKRRDGGVAMDGGDGGVDVTKDGGDDGGGVLPTNPIVSENALPGTAEWAIARPSPNHEIEAYADTTSAVSGDVVRLFASASVTSTFRWKFFRVGYYGGLGGRLIAEGEASPVTTQASCPVDPDTGLVECAWSRTFQITVQPTWVTGQYLFKLIRADGFETYVPLVVREPARRAPLLYQSSVTTWQAYNSWGGSSLYVNELPDSVGFTAHHAYQVSFDRPYEYDRLDNLEAERGAGEHFYSERYFLQWLEREGYDVAYATNLDVDADAALLEGRKLFTSVGHDEYWSLGERHAVQDARDAGVSLGFFSANAAYWRIRLEGSSSGVPRRVITCYKDRKLDPVRDAEDTTVRYREAPHEQPENALIGQMYELFALTDAFPLIVGDSRHWVYAGTGVSDGDTLSHVIGFEWDRANIDSNTPAGLEILATSPAFGTYGQDSASNVTVYYPTSHSIVFSGGSIQWSWGLGKPGYEDTRIEKMTENVLARAGLHPRVPTVVSAPPPPTDVGVATSVTLLAGSGVPGSADGDRATAQFDAPAGVAVDSNGNVFVTEARNHRVRKIGPDGTVSTLAGCGPDDSTGSSMGRDGQGAGACFDTPTGIAIGPDGLVYVADTHNNRIRVVDADGNVTTYAGTGSAGGADSTNLKRAQFAYPRGLAFGPDGALYVADAGNAAIRRIDANGVTMVAQTDTEVSGVAVARDGTVYAIVSGSNQVSVVQGGILVPIVNTTGTPGDQCGPGGPSMLRAMDGIVVDGTALIVSDTANERLLRIALTPDHTVTTLVGTGLAGSHLGTGATATLTNPRGLAVSNGVYFVADSDNHRILRVVP